MEYIIVILLIILIALTIAYFNLKSKKAEIQERGQKEFDDQLKAIIAQIEESQEKLKTINQVIAVQQERYDNELKYEKQKVQEEIKEWSKSAQEAASFNAETEQEILSIETDELRSQRSLISNELNQLVTEVGDYKKKRDAINQEILRARAIEEKQDFYRIQLDSHSMHDITILLGIKPQLVKFDLLDKLLYDNYIKKPVDEMIKRVLEGKKPCGIYKITRLKTGEVYVGKSTDVAARWQQHAKSCYHCGTISHSILHTTMEKDGIQNFTFELLEEVSKDQLTNREKYWIKFYDSTTYGLNEREG